MSRLWGDLSPLQADLRHLMQKMLKGLLDVEL